MTRINIVPPTELTDQHLFSEFREIKMIPKSLARSINARGPDGIWKIIPEKYTLNKGHVSFFYDKGLYLNKRFLELKAELNRRNVIDYNKNSIFDPDNIYGTHLQFFNDYVPDEEAFGIIRERIANRIAIRPEWYRFEGRPIIGETINAL